MSSAWLVSLLSPHAALLAFVLLLAGGLALPIPEDVVLVSAGIVAGLGHAGLADMLVITFLGVLLGDVAMYAIGWHWGDRIRQWRFFDRLVSAEREAGIRAAFARRGIWFVFAARFLWGIRVAVYLVAGMSRQIAPARFLLADGLAVLLTVPVKVVLGFYGAHHRAWLEQALHTEERVIGILAGSILLLLTLWWLWRRRISRQL
ncbi:DedA family protein [Laribacter hongkongensis]|uniref:DedA-family integral membrane protein n=1 Tax=Laribacter hongkongensis TaxID=168471 RepID=A0A248LEI7_9NEIS|nr:DedA family protein [Laribacter hongkongensis]ASJ23198.1 DedA-family integral membrane protein [Laribacter hongkongensis]MCG8991572.1 DedA family protein [Laribacter hongkongensis]MCG8994497.1 DedA family protein [Laribacter hongkongensis]MCG9001146.1 DedA family protein [Laribacter hongkongensis]MCG9003173.1 DedA family protein [Laribacter hongkongensis]